MNERGTLALPWRWPLLTAILLLAAFFRLYRLPTMPWGLSQDEVVNADISLNVLTEGGAPFLSGGFGHEPLFHYLQGVTLTLFGDNVIGIRMPAVMVGTLLVAAGYTLMRRMWGPVAAIATAVGLSVSWWPVIFSRIGIRAITFPLLLTLAIISLRRGLTLRRRALVILAGLLFGLTLYTYTSARVVPALALAWLMHATIFHRTGLQRHRKALLGAALVAIVVVAPLVLYLSAHPEIQERVRQLQGPLTALRQGVPGPLAWSVLDTLTMFSRNGEGRWTYGIPGRPILDVLSGALFYLGLIRCALHVRRPACGLLGPWLLIALAPSMVTPDAPSSIRAIGALPAAYGMIGVGTAWLWEWMADRGRTVRVGLLVALGLVGALHAGLTWRAGFGTWASHHEVYWLYKAHFADIAAFLDRQSASRPMVVFEAWVDPVDVRGLRRDLIHDERQPRWAQAGRSFVWPAGADRFTLAFPIYSQADPDVWRLFAGDPPVTSVSPFHMPDGRPGVTFYTIETEPVLSRFRARASTASVTLPQSTEAIPLPINFGHQIAFLGYQVLDAGGARPGGELRLITLWRVLRAAPEPVHVFVHLLDEGDEEPAAQHDGFDVWAASLRQGDVVAQLHPVPLRDDLSPGVYQIQVGLYTRADLRRLPVIVAGAEVADRVWLAPVEVTP